MGSQTTGELVSLVRHFHDGVAGRRSLRLLDTRCSPALKYVNVDG